MKYNLTQYAQTTSTGTMVLTTDELIDITSSITANVTIPVSGTFEGTVELESDLGARVHVDDVQYYFDSPEPRSTIASGIKFYYKNESFDVYTSLNTFYTNDYYYTVVSGTDAPRYLKVEHTIVSGTTGYLNGFVVLNNEDYVDFGADGSDTDTNFMLSVENSVSEINELEVFNSGPIKANAKIIIEPQRSVIDSVLKISDSPSGPWYGVYEDGDMVAGTGIWQTGEYTNTYESNGKLVLYPGFTEGNYKTRIFDLDENRRLTYISTDIEYPSKTPAVPFYDNFDYGDLYWDYQVSSRISFDNGKMMIQWSQVTFPETKTTIDFTDDWEFTFRIDLSTESTGRWRPRVTLFHDSGREIYVYWYFGSYVSPYDGTLDFYADGTSRWSITGRPSWNSFIDTWNWIKIKRTQENLKFKYWPTTSGEPSTWIWEGTITDYINFPTTGKIKVESVYAGGNEGKSYLDDFEVINNASTSQSDSSIVTTDAVDTYENVEVRSSNSRPLDRLTYIELVGSYSAAIKYTQHRWVEDGSIAETSSDWGTFGRSGTFWEVWYDSIQETEYIVDKPFYTGYGGDTNIYFHIRKKDEAIVTLKIAGSDYDTQRYYNTYRIIPDTSGGFWIYFYLGVTSSDNGSYYLRYYDSGLAEIYSRQATAAQGTFLYDMDSVYTSQGYLWYTDRDLATVFKIDTSGAILASFLGTEGIRGVLALEDGGCWVIQDQALLRLDADAVQIDAFELPSSLVSYVYSDLEDGFWLQDGTNIRHLDSTGAVTFSVERPNLYWFTVVDSGVVTKEHDGSTTSFPQASYISKYHQRVIRTWDYPQTEGGWKGSFDYNRYGFRSHTFDDVVDDHASHFPIPIDNNWVNLSNWKKVSSRDYNFTNEEYHQIRMTLRATSSAQSPEVAGVYTQRAIEIPNIYPGNYGTFYLKSDIAGLHPEDIGNYTSSIRAHWLLDSE